MGIRPNKTNFGLSFGHFGSKNVKKRGEEKKKKKKRKGMELFVYGTRTLYGNLNFCMDCYDLVWITMDMSD